MSSYANAGLFFLVSSLVLLVGLFAFNLLTRHNIWQEIGKGNVSVAMSTGGIVLGVANIIRSAISANSELAMTVLWGCVGTAALIAVYYLFELLTFKLEVRKEIGRDNRAVGFISLIFSLAFSLIIGASIS